MEKSQRQELWCCEVGNPLGGNNNATVEELKGLNREILNDIDASQNCSVLLHGAAMVSERISEWDLGR